MSTEKHQIIVNDLVVDVVRKNIKNLHLGVYPPAGRVRVAAPLRVNDEAVRLFTISRLAWIKRQQAKFEGQERQSAREYVSGESHYYQGNRYLLNVMYHQGSLKEEIAPLMAKWEAITGVKVAEWGVKQMKTRWGTCNIEARRIWLNLELIKKPVHCLEYIIVHEMMHLLERHHNERFIGYMNRFMPLWQYYREELNREPLGHVSWEY